MGFAQRVVAWQRRHGRRGLPWQGTRDPYRIWLSEIMLQQTQVSAVIPYYERFLGRFPTLEALARAREEEVLELWSGLGYYARGRNLLKAAREIARQGRFPRTAAEISQLPGVGRSTAGAIAALAFGERAAILDGNARRVLSRVFSIEGEAALWRLAEDLLPPRNVDVYTQALMDLGATVCTRRNPHCGACPVAALCVARREKRTAELPAPRRRAPVPIREATWFVCLYDDKVLLERRPDGGIWGGLWSFPEVRLFGRVRSRKLEVFEHGFTHFRLRVQPLLCRLAAAPRGRQPPTRCWMTIARATRAAVPVPVKRLLQRLS